MSFSYPVKFPLAAQRLRGDGWSYEQITDYLKKNGAPTIARSTVRNWCDHKRYNRHLEYKREHHGRPSPRERDNARMLEMWEAGLSATAIAWVMGKYHGLQIHPDSVYKRLRPERSPRPRGVPRKEDSC